MKLPLLWAFCLLARADDPTPPAGGPEAAPLDHRGWNQGQAAANRARFLEPPETQPIDLPQHLTKTLNKATLLLYFSPTCPHCQSVAPELNALAVELADQADLVGVASGSSSEDDVRSFVHTYKVRYRIVRDTAGDIGTAMGIRSTPSALLITPVGKKSAKAWHVVDGWYPYVNGLSNVVQMRLAQDPWTVFEGGSYLGNTTCGACHSLEADAWHLTHHSVAWRTLTLKGNDTNPECTNCHVTGAEQPGGWDGAPDSVLVDVGCEACHGPGGPHDGQATVPASTCATCHDAKHSIAFSYEKGLPLLDHYQSVPLDDETYRQRRIDLFEGNAPRELLAFAEGPTTTASACVACHPDQHAAWSNGPHAKAMGLLDEAQAAEVACVMCHATPTAFGGPPPSELSSFRTEESIGCESCHGPAEKHTSSNGAPDTIQGLGDSCPVCVIEAVCTSCHNKTQDPDWTLETALEQISH